MKYTVLLLFFALFVSITACSQKQNENKSSDAETAVVNGEKGLHKAEALEVKDVPQYTYVLVNEDGKEYWIAGPTTSVKKGETIYFLNPMEMRNFKSSALDKTFDSIFFVNAIAKSEEGLHQTGAKSNGAMTGMVSPHGNNMGNKETQKSAPPAKVDKKEGDLTIAKIFEQKDKFSGQEITFKGKVTKFLPDIMNKNWIHIQDGTDFNGYNDLVGTTKETFKVGDVVTIKGKLETDIDYGYGYKYEVILQDAVKVK